MRAVDELIRVLAEAVEREAPARILNVGAGRSLAVESHLHRRGLAFVSDRVDVEARTLPAGHFAAAHVGASWVASVESMPEVPSATYDAAFAVYVLEHVHDLVAAAREIRRVLRLGAPFIATVPNPSAPQMRLAEHSPLWFHRLIRRADAWELAYAFRTPERLAETFETAGFRRQLVGRYPNFEEYLARLGSPTGALGRVLDAPIRRWNVRALMGDACVVLEAR